MDKSPEAFRTISEVADWLGTPTHVLRFWESRFKQVKPVKRAGGRRYYRPKDMELLGGIKKLLHGDGMTIRGVQKLLRKEGVRHVAALSPPVDLSNVIEATATEAAIVLDVRPEPAQNVVPLQPDKPTKPTAPEGVAEPARHAIPDEKPASVAFVVEVPDDPDDDMTMPAAASAGIAAELRRATAARAGARPAPAEKFREIQNRLVRLKKSLDRVRGPGPTT